MDGYSLCVCGISVFRKENVDLRYSVNILFRMKIKTKSQLFIRNHTLAAGSCLTYFIRYTATEPNSKSIRISPAIIFFSFIVEPNSLRVRFERSFDERKICSTVYTIECEFVSEENEKWMLIINVRLTIYERSQMLYVYMFGYTAASTCTFVWVCSLLENLFA